jgi:hypothetical protein
MNAKIFRETRDLGGVLDWLVEQKGFEPVRKWQNPSKIKAPGFWNVSQYGRICAVCPSEGQTLFRMHTANRIMAYQLRRCGVGLLALLPQVPCNNGRTSGLTVSKLVHISTQRSGFTRTLSE